VDISQVKPEQELVAIFI